MTFQEYADMVFVSYMSTQLATAQRVDIVWEYIPRKAQLAINRDRREARACKGKWLPLH
jgi:hypothetical protein